MARYYYDFRNDTVGQPPAGWTIRWPGSGTVDWSIVNSDGVGGKSLRLNQSNPTSTPLSCDAAGQVQDVEIVMKFRATQKGWWAAAAYLRGSGVRSPDSRGAYWTDVGSADGVDALYVGQMVNGQAYYFSQSGIAIDFEANQWMWLRFRAVGQTYYSRVWWDGVEEPSGWTAINNGSSAPYAGWVGIGSSFQHGMQEFDVIGIGTNGDSAPSTPSDTQIDTPENYTFETMNPHLEFTGQDPLGSNLTYEINIEDFSRADIIDSSITFDSTTAFTHGRTSHIKSIAIHWWDDPSINPTLEGVVNWFKNIDNQVSAHFVVSDKTIVQLVELDDTAWHVLGHNPETIGIEIDPNFPGDTYKTVAGLVAYIRTKTGIDLPIQGHNSYPGNSTQCPGSTDIPLIDLMSRSDVQDHTVSITSLSEYDSGFVNTVTPTDTDPFNSGQKIRYTLQEDITDGSYRFRVRSKDVDVTKVWGGWSPHRFFRVETNSWIPFNSYGGVGQYNSLLDADELTTQYSVGLQSVLGESRITKSLRVAQSGIGRVVRTESSAQSGVSRITNLYSKSQPGISRISVSKSVSQPGVSRIESFYFVSSVEQLGRSIIVGPPRVSQVGRSIISRIESISQSGLSLISKTGVSTQTGEARVQRSNHINVYGRSKVTRVDSISQSGSGFIIVRNQSLQLGQSRIQKTSHTQIMGLSKISNPTPDKRPQEWEDSSQKTSSSWGSVKKLPADWERIYYE